MKKLESSLLNMTLVLTSVAVIMGGILALVNHLTEAPISEQEKKIKAEGIKSVMVSDELTVSKIDTIQQKDENGKKQTFVINKVKDANGNDLGAAVESTTMGFGGDLNVLVGFDPEGKILGYTILKHSETPGLGAKADRWFQKGEKGDIIGLDPGLKPIGVKKDKKDNEQQVDAITASTITSRAFLMAVNNAYNAYRKRPVTDAESGATKQIDK